MGKLNNVINRYLSDERRFAHLFNGIWFQGKGVISPEDLQDCSMFCTELKRLFTVIQYRKDRKSLKKIVWENKEYSHV